MEADTIKANENFQYRKACCKSLIAAGIKFYQNKLKETKTIKDQWNTAKEINVTNLGCLLSKTFLTDGEVDDDRVRAESYETTDNEHIPEKFNLHFTSVCPNIAK